MLPPVSIESLDLWFQVQHSPFWTNLTFACKTDTLGSLVMLYWFHALLILTKSPKSKKNQVVHEQNFKYLRSSTSQISSEKRVLDLETEVHWLSIHLGENILFQVIFISRTKASDANIVIIANFF